MLSDACAKGIVMINKGPIEADFARLRRRIGATASAIASTEERIACTFDRIAADRPRDAARLHAQAAQAREIAARERDRAESYGWDPGAPESEKRPLD